MPLVQIKIFENELNQQQSADLIKKITDVVAGVAGEKLRDVTWVVIEEIKSGQWGIAGNPLGLNDVKKLLAS